MFYSFSHLKEEVTLYLVVEKTSFEFSLHDEIWKLKVQFLSDLFEKLDSLNLNLQALTENIVTSTSKLKSFEEKLILWKSEISKEGLLSWYQWISVEKKCRPKTSFKSCFPLISFDEYEWLINPFVISKHQIWQQQKKNSLLIWETVSFTVQHSSRKTCISFGFLSKIRTLQSAWKLLKFFCLLHLHGSVNLDFQHWPKSSPKSENDF